jgi:hypothetical protein
MIERGVRFPPLKTDAHGKLVVSESMFLEAEADEQSMGIMDKPGICDEVRYIRVSLLSRRAVRKLATQRENSRWPLMPLEKSLYGDLPSLLAAYCSSGNLDVVPAYRRLDLHTAPSSPTITLLVRRLGGAGDGESAV